MSRNFGLVLMSSRSLVPSSSVVRRRSSTTVSKSPASSASRAAGAFPTGTTSTSSPRSRSAMLCCCTTSSSTRSSFFTFLSTKLAMWLKAPSRASLLTGFSRYANAPIAAPFLLLHDGDDVHRDVAGARVALQPVEDAPAVHDGKLDVQRDG